MNIHCRNSSIISRSTTSCFEHWTDHLMPKKEYAYHKWCLIRVAWPANRRERKSKRATAEGNNPAFFLPLVLAALDLDGGRWQRRWNHPKKKISFSERKRTLYDAIPGQRRVVAHMPSLSLPGELIYLVLVFFFGVVTFSVVHIIIGFLLESKGHVTSTFDDLSIKWADDFKRV